MRRVGREMKIYIRDLSSSESRWDEKSWEENKNMKKINIDKILYMTRNKPEEINSFLVQHQRSWAFLSSCQQHSILPHAHAKQREKRARIEFNVRNKLSFSSINFRRGKKYFFSSNLSHICICMRHRFPHLSLFSLSLSLQQVFSHKMCLIN